MEPQSSKISRLVSQARGAEEEKARHSFRRGLTYLSLSLLGFIAGAIGTSLWYRRKIRNEYINGDILNTVDQVDTLQETPPTFETSAEIVPLESDFTTVFGTPDYLTRLYSNNVNYTDIITDIRIGERP